MRKILISLPVKGQLSTFVTKNLMDCARLNIPGVKLDFAFLEGAPVNQARNELALRAMEGGYDELVMIDKDLDVSAQDLTRLISHEHAKVVCGLYPHRSLDTHWHVKAWSATEESDATDLLRVNQCAVGFAKIRTSVFLQLAKDNPDRAGLLTQPGKQSVMLHEFFPMELVGPNTAEARLEAVKNLIPPGAIFPDGELASVISSIITALTVTNHGFNLHTAEDYGFCRLCRKSDIPILVDTHLIVQHEDSVMLPIASEQLVAMLKESWRETVKAPERN